MSYSLEEAWQNIITNSTCSWSQSNSVISSRLPSSFAGSEGIESSCIEISPNSSGRQMVNLSQPEPFAISPQKDGNSTFTVAKSSGIGLHLNSISHAMPIDSCATVNIKSDKKGCFNIKGKLVPPDCHISQNTTSSSTFPGVIQKASASNRDGSQETQSSVAESSASSLSPHFANLFNSPVMLRPNEYEGTQYDKRTPNSEHADAVEEFDQLSPQKKRKKVSDSSDSDGCKRCNCKKTKCLKLYCDCFAAALYCAGSCSCQECYNRKEYEDTVLEAREQIETRNPHAFAPKIVGHVPESSIFNNVVGNCSTQSSAKHKKGCNCKKSMCLKRYCECYQANVGCSNACRCEGCKNVYGKKEDYGRTQDVTTTTKRKMHEILKSTFDEEPEMVATRDGFLQTELCNPHCLTPLTPSLQCSDVRKDTSKSQFPFGRYIPSPESGLPLFPPYGKPLGSTRSFGDREPLFETSIFHPLDPSIMLGSSTSSQASDWTNISCTQSGSGCFPTASSLGWGNLPVTPTAQFVGAKIFQVPDSSNRFHDILEDEMPDILKGASNPSGAVKVCSPEKKRVSPPYSHLHEAGSRSSGGLRSGRKFILQAVPSFPPLTTPCIDSKDGINQNIDDSQDCSRK